MHYAQEQKDGTYLVINRKTRRPIYDELGESPLVFDCDTALQCVDKLNEENEQENSR